jgi:hypothetical protein
MFPKIITNEKFQKEYTDWKKSIESLENVNARQKGEKLLKDLMYHAELIDNGHDTSFLGYISPLSVRENVESLQTIRQKLTQFVRDIHR